MATIEAIEEYSFLFVEYPSEEFSEEEQHIAVPIMFIIGVFGLIANIWELRIIWKSSFLHNCFGYLLVLHAFSNIVLLCCFVFWPIPVIFDDSLIDSTLGFKVGQITIICYYIALYAQLAKAINRFFAIYSPVKYRKWFSNKNSKFIILLAIVLGLTHGILYFFPGCNLCYDGLYVTWEYDYTSCYDIMSFYTDFVICFSIILSIMLIDGSTLYLIIRYRYFKKGENKEIRLFLQTFSTSILYTLSAISDQYLCYLNMNRWYMFVSSTLAWELCHVIDGVLMIVFTFRKKTIQTSSVTPLTTGINNRNRIRVT